MELTNEMVIELIKAGGSILTATIPSVVSFYLGRKFMDVAKLKERYKVALNDILYLLGVEELHCREHMETQDKSLRKTVRDSVRVERGLDWSGKHTPSQIAKRVDQLK